MILVPGGCGYIGSHTVLTLLQAGYEVLVLDNLCNSSEISLQRVAKLCGKKAAFVRGDIRDRALLDRLFADYAVSAVINFAGLKAVGESVEKPLLYYQVNVGGALTLLEAMQAAGVYAFIFSSSATVYGQDAPVPYRETTPTGATANPYGHSKLMIEEILHSLYRADKRWKIARLRYFNPIGAHESGEIGEDPSGIPNNLLPYIAQVAIGKLPQLRIFGNDYPTPDGTGMRDYIHVCDLADGHVKALEAIADHPGLYTWNLGTGQPYSVMEVLRAFEKACGKTLAYEILPRREGDLASYYADAEKARRELGWEAVRGLEEMVRDTWRWQSQNPHGYR